MIYREAAIILPTNAGADAHEYMRNVLLNTFGGYTAVPASGGWRDPNGHDVVEAGSLYIVAVPCVMAVPAEVGGPVQRSTERDWIGARAALLHIASRAASLGRQICVYTRLPPDGNILLVKPSGASLNPDAEA
jgi:hypothetical protein